MSRVAEQRLTDGAADEDSASAGDECERHTVSQLVRSYDDARDGQKRDRSESGESAPAGKRGARECGGEPVRSPSSSAHATLRERMEIAFDDLERRVTQSLLRDLHEFRANLSEEIEKLSERVRDLERHVEERDGTIEQLSEELQKSREEVAVLQLRAEEAEINSRLPCLILSGAALAPRNAPRLGPPLSAWPAPGEVGRSQSSAPAPAPAGRGAMTSQPAERSAGGGERRGARGQSAAGGRGWEEREDVNALVIAVLNRSMPGLNIIEEDIDRAHRLPGPNNRVIVRFVRSGQGSVRDKVWSRRLELRGKELFINESLTRLRGQIFRSLLAAKREKKIYTVYSRGGHVHYKEQQHGVSTRVDSLQRLRERGFTVLER